MKKFDEGVIDLFGKKTGCGIQYRRCPCGSCFHAIDDNLDWKHICWILLLGIRGDYNSPKLTGTLLRELRKELR